jgi:hypothetical protein
MGVLAYWVTFAIVVLLAIANRYREKIRSTFLREVVRKASFAIGLLLLLLLILGVVFFATQGFPE